MREGERRESGFKGVDARWIVGEISLGEMKMEEGARGGERGGDIGHWE